MKKLIFTLINIFAFIGLSLGQWVSPGNGETYNLSELVNNSNGCVIIENNGQFTITADLTISANDILVIDQAESGIAVEDGKRITVNGSFVCENHDYQILMTGDNAFGTQNGYFSMRFDNAVNNIINNINFENCGGIQLISSDIIFDNCEFENFNTSYISSAINYFECNPIIQNCYFHDNEGAAISSGANIMGSPKILSCTFFNNVTANSNYPQINLGPGAEDTIYIIGNHIEGVASDKSGGIAIADLMATGSTKALVSNNTIINNRYGYTQQGTTISAVVCDNIFKDNNLETNPMNGGSGISIYGYGTACAAILRNNLITGNLWGITTIYYNNVDMGTEEDWGNNVIYNNGNGGVLYELYNNSYCNITAIGNYWGANDENYPETVIFHQPDQADLGLVTFAPVKQLFPDLISLSFLQADNPTLSQDYFGIIDNDNHTVAVTIEDEIDVSTLIMNYQTELGVTGNFASGTAHNFTEPVILTLSTPHNTSQEWTITVDIYNYITDNQYIKATIYPNPVADKLFITCKKDVTLSIYNTAGKIIYSATCNEEKITIDVKEFESGIYFIKIIDADNRYNIQKIIKI